MYHGQDRYQFQTPIVKLDRRLRCWPKWHIWEIDELIETARKQCDDAKHAK